MFKKTLFAGVALLMMLSACNFETKAYKKLKFEKDSIQYLQTTQLDQLEGYIATIQEVDSTFNAIRQSQNILNLASYDEAGNHASMQQKVSDNMAMIQKLLADNQSKIAQLQRDLRQSDLRGSKLQASVKRLTKELKQKTQEIEELQALLIEKNYQIDSLIVANKLSQDWAESLAQENAIQDSILNQQDVQLHQAYFFMGNRKALRDSNINVKDSDTGYQTNLFTPVDVRYFQSLATHSKSADILTKHPENSYEWVKEADKTYTLVIKNSADFWSVSRYLIIKIK